MKAILVIEFDDEWLDRINTTYDEMIADVTVYKKDSLKKQCDYNQRLYRCWCPLKPLPNAITERGKWISEEYQKGWNAYRENLE